MKKYNKRRLKRKLGTFGMQMLQLTAAIIGADLEFSADEKTYLTNYLIKRFGSSTGKHAFYYIVDAVSSKINLNEVCNQAKASSDYDSRLHLMYLLFGIAASDNDIHPQEKIVIKQIADNLEIISTDFDSLYAMYFETEEASKQKEKEDETTKFDPRLENTYSVLGISRDSSIEDIKKAYRILANQHHPDKVAYLGDIHQQAAREKFEKIKAAYDILLSRKNQR